MYVQHVTLICFLAFLQITQAETCIYRNVKVCSKTTMTQYHDMSLMPQKWVF